MNWAGASVVLGLATVGIITLPWGLPILVGLAYIWWRGMPK